MVFFYSFCLISCNIFSLEPEKKLTKYFDTIWNKSFLYSHICFINIGKVRFRFRLIWSVMVVDLFQACMFTAVINSGKLRGHIIITSTLKLYLLYTLNKNKFNITLTDLYFCSDKEKYSQIQCFYTVVEVTSKILEALHLLKH